MIYGNRVALRLFDCSWETFRGLVGHDTAPVAMRAARSEAVRRVRRVGRIDDYGGVRTAVTGRRFALAHATVCVIDDEDGAYAGYVAIAEVGDAAGGGR